jgi:hypothetical protein
MPIIISAWNTKSPTTNAATYSITRSMPLGRPNAGTMAAAITIPVASPARQCISLFTPCFQSARVKTSCSPRPGLRQASR